MRPSVKSVAVVAPGGLKLYVAGPVTYRPRPMLDKSKSGHASGGETAGPPRDFQEHLARLEARGLLTRIDRPINKDTELHPLARWQFQGGLPEGERRAFLFTNVVDPSGRRYAL